VSSVSEERAKKFKLNIKTFKRTITCETINGSSECLGQTTCEVQIGYETLKVNFLVIKNCKKDVLLGLDVIKQFKLATF